MRREEREAVKCREEIEAVLKKRGFVFSPVPRYQQTQGGAFVTTVEIMISKVEQKKGKV